MEDDGTGQFLVDLRSLEDKVGMKTPESLLRWMHAGVQDLDSLDSDHLPRDLLTKIKALKLEMRKLRSTDVKILQQLEALNEGMECMRWLWEERSSQISLITNQNNQDTPFSSNNQVTSDLASCQISLTPAEHAKSAAAQFMVSRSTDHTITRPEPNEVPVLGKGSISGSQGMVLGHVESLDVQCSEAQRPKNKQNDPDPYPLGSELLLGYDVRWRWVEHEDDVMFL